MKSVTFLLCLLSATVSLFAQSTMFPYGVASGDPRQESVVLWTKLQPSDKGQVLGVKVTLANDTLMKSVAKSVFYEANNTNDFVVKLSVDGLEPGKTYFYQFECQGQLSVIGRTKTAPEGNVSDLKFLVASCANYQGGYYNAYGNMAKQQGVQAVLFLGDYIYEYSETGYGNDKLTERRHLPKHEIIKLDDYRQRYAQYRSDANLQEAHRLHPFICIWDDHEVANDTYKDGAQNHDPKTEGDFQERKRVARQAYFEWMPVQDNEQKSIIREFSFGNLADLFMLDGRLEGRSKQVRDHKDSTYRSPERTMLGNDQADWLMNGVADSGSKWKLVGNQVVFSSIDASKVFKKNPKFMDMWDGYPAERHRIMEFWRAKKMRNIVVLTGDVHTAWAMELTENPKDTSFYNRKTGKGVMGAEFVAPSITSSNYDEYVPRILADLAKARFKGKHNPHLRFHDLVHHGYMILNLSQEKAEAQWVFMKSILKPDPRAWRSKSFFIRDGGRKIERK